MSSSSAASSAAPDWVLETRRPAPRMVAGGAGVPSAAGAEFSAGAGAGELDGGPATSSGVSTSDLVTRWLAPAPFLMIENPWSVKEKHSAQVWLLTRCRGHLKLAYSESTWARLS